MALSEKILARNTVTIPGRKALNLAYRRKTMHPLFIKSLNVIKEKLSHHAFPGHVLKDWYARELVTKDQYQALLPYYFATSARSN
tara:strand:+ start:52 stop:306 length:255 start_codon:yes stop_codon:yes gene_type:complete